jgi:hypothetical protein
VAAADEVLLREAHDLANLPVSVFRCDMIMADTTYAGQLNVPRRSYASEISRSEFHSVCTAIYSCSQ